MNEIECIIDEVHDHVINSKKLSNDLSINIIRYDKIIINYYNLNIILKQKCFVVQLTEYKHIYQNYVLDKDIHFNTMLVSDVLCNINCMKKMVDIREYYGFKTLLSDRFLDYNDFNETE